LYVDDLISAFYLCLKKGHKFKRVDYVNIGSGVPSSVSDILRELEAILGKKLKIYSNQEKFRKDETPVEFCSHKKLTQLTGWTPKYDLHNGLLETLRGEGIVQ
ncbi:MAG: hypothetical protein IJ597_06080, partial [Synergistaceae bacterium]|nr:hypothetical protein [Synergistaceae bacterium]